MQCACASYHLLSRGDGHGQGQCAPRGPGVVTRLGPLMPGLVMSRCAIQTPAHALSSQPHQGLSIIASVTEGEIMLGLRRFCEQGVSVVVR